MPDLNKEYRTALIEGIVRLVQRELGRKGLPLEIPGRHPRKGTPTGASTADRTDQRTVTGYDHATQKTTLAFHLGLSALDGSDQLSH